MTRPTTPDMFAEPIPNEDKSLAAMGIGYAAVLPDDLTSMPIADIVVNDRRRQLNMAKAYEVADSIGRIGLLEPLIVRENRTLVAGRHRLEALRILGWTMAPVRVVCLSDLDAELAEIDENLIRNELNLLERAEHLARRKEIYEAIHPEARHGASGGWHNNKGASLEKDTLSFSSDAAAKLNVSPRTVRRDVKIGTSIADDVRDWIIRPGERIIDSPINRRLDKLANSQTELLHLAKMDEDQQRAILERILLGASTVNEAERELYQEALEESAVAIEIPWLLVGDFRTVGRQVPNESVDLIFTDPPYDEASSALFDDLAQFAARVLKPGGILLTYSGQLHLPQIYAAMGQHLQYMWTCAIGHGGGATWFRKWHLLNQWKPILMYGKPPIKTWWANSFADYVVGGKEKSAHEWQQALGEALHYIKAVCPPGGVVCDPFLGSGTTAKAAKQLGMQYIGIEKDPATAARARVRVEETPEL